MIRKADLTTWLEVVAAITTLVTPVVAQETKAPPQTLITNVSIFDGTSEKLITGRDIG